MVAAEILHHWEKTSPCHTLEMSNKRCVAPPGCFKRHKYRGAARKSNRKRPNNGKGETNQIRQEKEPVSKNVHKIIVDNGLNQHDEGMLTEENFVPDTCCMCLKETSDALACKMCRRKIHTFCGRASKGDEMAQIAILVCSKFAADLHCKSASFLQICHDKSASVKQACSKLTQASKSP
ncbi:hypothetical protein AVEN_28424-1 [Araneus ventricosus]|uniref:Uncharacterized protein n=1 Tax=Araneus ventricosus TaxID=182803 RepID=A0A4Y2L7Y6_ARAVE|nr:hypothetical protein AVEN_28424-1 [Araneus ventricosus]